MICVVPEPVTWLLSTAMLSTVELSDVFLIVILPVSTSTASEKFRMILLSTVIPVAPKAGDELLKVGTPTSAEVNERLVVSLIPAYELPEESSKAVAAI